jgi:two-component system LytT family sensor kinase
MHIPENKFVNRSFFKTNFLYGLVGIGIGLFICALEYALNNKLIPLNDIISTLLISTVITLSITNPIYIFLRYFHTQKPPRWKFLLVYYGCNLLGMLVGIELSYWAISAIFHVPYVFLSHYSDYRFSFLIVLVVSTIVYLYRAQQATLNERLRKKELDLAKVQQLITQAELQTLQSKINPHFLYNSLNSIASLIREDADKAEDMTLKLSRLFRYSINSQQENMALVTEEMEIVNTYLAIEKVRFGDRLSFVIDINEDVKNMLIPRFLIQPLVENALKHGLNNKADNGELKININRDENTITISIADNGKPFPAELNVGYGLQSTYDKLALLYGENYQVQITNSPEKQVKILIPVTT